LSGLLARMRTITKIAPDFRGFRRPAAGTFHAPVCLGSKTEAVMDKKKNLMVALRLAVLKNNHESQVTGGAS
jgi:hypothetical protein